MQVEVRLDGSPLRRWHLELLRRLAPYAAVSVAVTPEAGGGLPAGVERVLALERLVHRRRDGLSRPVPAAALDGHAGAEGTRGVRVLDLRSTPEARPGVWRLEFDGRAGEQALLDALRARRFPVVTVTDGATTVAAGRPGSEFPGALVAAFDDVLAGCLTLLVGAVRGAAFAAPAELPDDRPTTAPPLARHLVGLAAGLALRTAYRALYRAPHWRVGWRFVDGPGLVEGGDRRGWTDLPDDGLHFYADPFPFEHDGRHYVFVEDYDHRLGRGVISVVEFTDDGPSPARPVLRHEVHLSYPFVVADAGRVYLIPETSAARRVELYEAVDFPDTWRRVAVLVDGVEASDATVVRHADRWWLSATVRDGGSFSDALHLWSAEALTGPWRPHPSNPVLVDIAAARPAGRVVPLADGRLLRPVQDGRGGYGAALAVAEITRLDDTAFEQRVVETVGPGDWWPGRRLHTVNRAGRLECIDGSALSPRYRRRRAGDVR